MFYYLAKTLWYVAQPSALMIIGLATGLWLLARDRHPAAARACLTLALVIGLAAASPIPNLLALPLEQRFPRVDLTQGPPVTGIVVLGGAEDAPIALARHAHALNESAERITEAVALALLQPQARIVFTGGSGFLNPGGPTEADAVRQMLLSMGLSGPRLTLEENARDTWENATLTRNLAKPQPGERWLLVTSAWHMPRAMGVFRKAGFPVEPWPVDYRTTGWANAWHAFASPADGLRRLELELKEYAGLLAYWLRGRSSSLFPARCPSTPTCE